jgi:hypothetical protein
MNCQCFIGDAKVRLESLFETTEGGIGETTDGLGACVILPRDARVVGVVGRIGNVENSVATQATTDTDPTTPGWS